MNKNNMDANMKLGILKTKRTKNHTKKAKNQKPIIMASIENKLNETS